MAQPKKTTARKTPSQRPAAQKTTPATKQAVEVKPVESKPATRSADGSRPSAQPATVPAPRTARLRLVHVDPWSVMRMTFLLSIVLGIATVIAVFVIWLLLDGTGVWNSINHSVRDTVGSTTTVPFDITSYLGLGRVVGFTMLAAVIDAGFFTAIATLGAFLYNLAANLLGGIEATYAEDR